MASEEAKALARAQKEAAKAEKLRKKHSDDPADWGRTRQIIETYKRTKEVDPKLGLYLWGSALLVLVFFGLLAIWIQPWWLTTIFGGLFAILAPMYVLTYRAKKGMFTRYDGQAGSAEVALSMLNKKKWTYATAVSFNRNLDVIHRAVGRPGIVLIGEGHPARINQMMAAEKKKHEAVAYGVPVVTIIMGNSENQVPLSKLQRTIEKLPNAIQPHEITEINGRLRALDATRPKVPMPKGPMPKAKGVGRAMRGR